MKIMGKAQHLADSMIHLSLKHYSNEWMMGLEYELWREITEDPEILSSEEADSLKTLAEMCNGWIVMNYETDTLEFVSRDYWLKTFREKSPF